AAGAPDLRRHLRLPAARRRSRGRRGGVRSAGPAGARAVGPEGRARQGARLLRAAARRRQARAGASRSGHGRQGGGQLGLDLRAGAHAARDPLVPHRPARAGDAGRAAQRRVRRARDPHDARAVGTPHRDPRPLAGRHGPALGAAVLARHAQAGRRPRRVRPVEPRHDRGPRLRVRRLLGGQHAAGRPDGVHARAELVRRDVGRHLLHERLHAPRPDGPPERQRGDRVLLLAHRRGAAHERRDPGHLPQREVRAPRDRHGRPDRVRTGDGRARERRAGRPEARAADGVRAGLPRGRGPRHRAGQRRRGRRLVPELQAEDGRQGARPGVLHDRRRMSGGRAPLRPRGRTILRGHLHVEAPVRRPPTGAAPPGRDARRQAHRGPPPRRAPARGRRPARQAARHGGPAPARHDAKRQAGHRHPPLPHLHAARSQL
ncbi:MAG: lipase, class 2, partial [uncultured Solirubrobacteraceae bacterium]